MILRNKFVLIENAKGKVVKSIHQNIDHVLIIYTDGTYSNPGFVGFPQGEVEFEDTEDWLEDKDVRTAYELGIINDKEKEFIEFKLQEERERLKKEARENIRKKELSELKRLKEKYGEGN